MKVILNSDIAGKGELGDIIEVKAGYARNFLFPRQLALKINKHNLEVIKARKKKIAKKLEIEKLSAQEQKQKIEELKLTMIKKAGENDILFGSVTTQDIENELIELGVHIDRKKIHLEEPIKRLGNYSCKIKLMKDVEADLKIEVVGEAGEQKPVSEEKGDKEETGAEKETEDTEKAEEKLKEETDSPELKKPKKTARKPKKEKDTGSEESEKGIDGEENTEKT